MWLLKVKNSFWLLSFFYYIFTNVPPPPILLEVEFLTQYVQTIPPTFFNLLVHIVSDSPPGGFHLPVPIFIGCFLFWTHLSIWVFYFSLLSLRFPFSFSFFFCISHLPNSWFMTLVEYILQYLLGKRRSSQSPKWPSVVPIS